MRPGAASSSGRAVPVSHPNARGAAKAQSESDAEAAGGDERIGGTFGSGVGRVGLGCGCRGGRPRSASGSVQPTSASGDWLSMSSIERCSGTQSPASETTANSTERRPIDAEEGRVGRAIGSGQEVST